MATSDSLTAAELRRLLHYDLDTGTFRWISGGRGRPPLGTLAGSPMGNGYWRIMVRYQSYGAHRLAWLYVTGEWPDCEVDHIDQDPMNNRFVNLRLATRKQNAENQRTSVTNTSGFNGVHYERARGKWRADMEHNGRCWHVGRFDTKDEAIAARIHAELIYFTHSPASSKRSRRSSRGS